MNAYKTFLATVFTPLGDEEFYLSLPFAGNDIDLTGIARIWNNKGSLEVAGIEQQIDSVMLRMNTDVPFETELRINVSISETKDFIDGRISIGDIGWVDYHGREVHE